jgi:adenylyltransferase/sulfurtransferase
MLKNIVFGLSETERLYYEKHINLTAINENGQDKLKRARVLVIGAGGLGCPALLNLVTSGIGNIGIIDFDKISISNLHRQTLYTYDDIGKFKSIEAARKLKIVNPYVKIEAFNKRVDENNIEELIVNYDIILDSPDNYETRYIIEDISYKNRKIIVHGSVFQFQGQVAIFNKKTPCYRCVFPEVPSGMSPLVNSSKGIFGPLASIIGTMQAIETIKIIIGMGTIAENYLLCYNALDQSIKKYKIHKNPNCIVCGERKG